MSDTGIPTTAYQGCFPRRNHNLSAWMDHPPRLSSPLQMAYSITTAHSLLPVMGALISCCTLLQMQGGFLLLPLSFFLTFFPTPNAYALGLPYREERCAGPLSVVGGILSVRLSCAIGRLLGLTPTSTATMKHTIFIACVFRFLWVLFLCLFRPYFPARSPLRGRGPDASRRTSLCAPSKVSNRPLPALSIASSCH